MKILHVRASNFYGGPERQLHLHAREARDTEFEVTVASFHEGGRPPEFLAPIAADGIPTHSFDVRSSYDPRGVAMLRDYLREQEFDLLCTHEHRSSTLAWLAVRGTKARWIAFSRGFTTENLKMRVFQGIERLVVRSADHIVAVSRSQKEKLERLWIPSDRISVVPNAIDPGYMAQLSPVDLRGRIGCAPEDFVCVAGGRFSREKGQVYLIDATAEALREAPGLRVVMFGEGPERGPLLRRIAALGLQDRILCPGFEKDMAGCVRAADLLVNPSLSEGMPNIVLEAMALGTPVLATGVGGVPEIIEDGSSGRLVPAADVEALAAGLVAAASRPEEGRAMALRASERAREELGFGRQLERMREAYEKGWASRG